MILAAFLGGFLLALGVSEFLDERRPALRVGDLLWIPSLVLGPPMVKARVEKIQRHDGAATLTLNYDEALNTRSA